ncbi:DNA helicase [Tanacetum coccineum]
MGMQPPQLVVNAVLNGLLKPRSAASWRGWSPNADIPAHADNELPRPYATVSYSVSYTEQTVAASEAVSDNNGLNDCMNQGMHCYYKYPHSFDRYHQEHYAKMTPEIGVQCVDKAIKKILAMLFSLRPTKLGQLQKSIEDVRMSKRIGWGIMATHRSEKDILKKPRATFPPAMSNTNKPVMNNACLQQKGQPIDKAVGTNIGLPMGNTIPKVTRHLPTECRKRGTAKLQITGANVDGVDPYSLKTCDILEMIYENRDRQTRQLSKDEAETSCSSNQDESETSCIIRHILQAPTNNDEDERPSLRRRPKIHNFDRTYLDRQRKTKWRNRHGNRLYLDPIGTQYLAGESVSVSNRIPPEHSHLGQCTCVCRHCGAMFWECEKVASASHTSQFGYNKCCYRGRIILRPPPEYPQYIKELYENTHFMDNIRAYNQMFSMTSVGANVDNSINNGKGPYVFRISGQLYHWIGSLCPEEGQSPRFLQLYIYDTTNEVKNRLSHFSDEHQSELKEEVVEGLIEFLDTHNALVQLFRTARNKHIDADIPEFKVRLYNVIGARQYELPTSETIGAIVFGDSSTSENEFDLIIEEHSQFPQRVSKLHPCYMSLQFPLLFVYGEDGYKKDMKLANIPGQSTKANKRMSMNMYYSYQIHDRLNHYNLLLHGGKLFQQYVVTAYCAIEQSRLDYIRQKQDDIRSEYLSGIYDAILRGDRDGSDLGLRTVLTASFTGSPRYMYAHYLDALAICRLTVADRADIVDRVFEKKVRNYIDFVRDSNTFGSVAGDIRKINNKIYPTNKAACQALGLLSSDQEWVTTLQEASLFATTSELRSGINLPFLIWGEKAENFDMDEYNKMEKPVIIAIASAWATKKYGAPNGWYYRKCNACNVKVSDDSALSLCQNHGPQPIPNYGYCFKAIINDGTATATVTCFSPEAHTFVPDCNTIVNTIEDKDTTYVPTVLTQTEGHTYIFQYRFGQKAKPGYPNFTLDAVLQPLTEPLLAMPAAETIKSVSPKICGINLPFLIWGENAENFDMDEYNKMEKPVIIAIASAWAIKKYRGTSLHRRSKLEYKFQDKEYSEDIFSSGSALEDFICVVIVPDRNISPATQFLEETSIGNIPTTTDKEASEYGKPDVEAPSQIPKEKAKKNKAQPIPRY